MRAKPDPKTREKHVRTLETSHRNWTERVGDFEPLREKRKKVLYVYVLVYYTGGSVSFVQYTTRGGWYERMKEEEKKLTIFTLGTPNRPTRWSLWWTAKSIQAQTLFAQFSVLFENKVVIVVWGPNERERRAFSLINWRDSFALQRVKTLLNCFSAPLQTRWLQCNGSWTLARFNFNK